jgi:hypothetical protein
MVVHSQPLFEMTALLISRFLEEGDGGGVGGGDVGKESV